MLRPPTALLALTIPLVALSAHADDTTRSFGVGVGGGGSWTALLLTGGGNSATATATSVFYPSLELQFFNDARASIDVSIPVGNMVYAAENGATLVSASAYYSPHFHEGTARGVLGPGLGLGYDSQGAVSATELSLLLRAGVELVTSDERFAVKFLAQPSLSVGVAAAPEATVGVFGFALTGVIVVSLYGTHIVPKEAPATEPSHRDSPQPEDEASERALDAFIQAVQKHPKVPEIGATKAEAQALCVHQRGVWIDQGQKVGCKVRRENLFVCELADESTVNACTHWRLGADLTDERDTIAERNGKPTATSVERGFRAYTWELPGETITLTAYPAGVVVTDAKTISDTAPAPSSPPPP